MFPPLYLFKIQKAKWTKYNKVGEHFVHAPLYRYRGRVLLPRSLVGWWCHRTKAQKSHWCKYETEKLYQGISHSGTECKSYESEGFSLLLRSQAPMGSFQFSQHCRIVTSKYVPYHPFLLSQSCSGRRKYYVQ